VLVDAARRAFDACPSEARAVTLVSALAAQGAHAPAVAAARAARAAFPRSPVCTLLLADALTLSARAGGAGAGAGGPVASVPPGVVAVLEEGKRSVREVYGGLPPQADAEAESVAVLYRRAVEAAVAAAAAAVAAGQPEAAVRARKAAQADFEVRAGRAWVLWGCGVWGGYGKGVGVWGGERGMGSGGVCVCVCVCVGGGGVR
jgi:hypothetical protein